MIIGANNVFEVDCNSEALKIGDNNVLEAKCLYNQCFVSDINVFRFVWAFHISTYTELSHL
jgi:hypothetical protein